MAVAIDLRGKRFGRYLVVDRSGASASGQAKWLCQCDCGNEKVVVSQALRSAAVVSCGCHKDELTSERFRRHGHSRRSPEYIAWANIVQRCENTARDDFHLYGARGIKVCERWRDSFGAFLTDVGPRPGPGQSIDRIDNAGDYEPGNVRWATADIQANNKRNNRSVMYRGRTMTVREAMRLAARPVGYGTIMSRLTKGWPAEAAIETPIVPLSGKRERGSRHY